MGSLDLANFNLLEKMRGQLCGRAAAAAGFKQVFLPDNHLHPLDRRPPDLAGLRDGILSELERPCAELLLIAPDKGHLDAEEQAPPCPDSGVIIA